MAEAVGYGNEGYEWIIDGTMENFIDAINQDQLSLHPEKANNDKRALHLIRLTGNLKTGVLGFVRYPDDTNIFVKSQEAASGVKESAMSWLEWKRFLTTNKEKTTGVRNQKWLTWQEFRKRQTI